MHPAPEPWEILLACIVLHFLPLHILLHIYQSLISPYITYGLSVWGQASKCHLDKIFILQKGALRFMYSTKKNEHTIPLFINAKILPLNFLYSALINICNLFTKTTSVHAMTHVLLLQKTFT